MRVLVTWGSERGGTEGIARIIGERLQRERLEVELIPAACVKDVARFDAVIVGGALYANRWHRDARRFVLRNTTALRRLPVWFFSSGPLDDSAARKDVPPTSQVKALMERVGARGHKTFGGRLATNAKGFAARAMAKEHAGDWRNPAHIRGWASALASAMPNARAGIAVDHEAYSPWSVLAYGVLGWGLSAAVLMLLLAISTGVAFAARAIAAPIIFAAVSRSYFARRGPREPLPTALAFTGIVAMLDVAVIAGWILDSMGMFASIVGTWLPYALIFASSWITGFIVSTLPWPTTGETTQHQPAR